MKKLTQIRRGSKKRAYLAPVVSLVPLVVDETLFTACKTTGIGGPSGTQNCNKAGGCIGTTS